MSEPFIGEIIMFGGNFAPRGWALCNGQLLPIAQNTALFSLLGTTYGGNGQTTFALPDLRGRVPLHPGQGPGLSSHSLGEAGGTETHTLSINELPVHDHGLPGFSGRQTTNVPTGAVPAHGGNYAAASSANVAMGRSAATGGAQPFSIVQPYLGVNFIIALEGIYPSRN
ncbi:MAG: phage tail protein [Mycobacteriales bacterium]